MVQEGIDLKSIKWTQHWFRVSTQQLMIVNSALYKNDLEYIEHSVLNKVSGIRIDIFSKT